MKIPSIEGFGGAIATPSSFQQNQVPAGAFGAGVGAALQDIGQDMESTQARDFAIADAERKQLIREDVAAHKQEIAEARAARKAADSAKALQVNNMAQSTIDDLADEFSQRIKTGQLDKTKAPQEWAQQSRQALEDTLKDMPEEYKANSAAVLGRRSAQLTRKVVMGAVRERDKDDTRAAIIQTNEYAQRLYATDPKGAAILITQTYDQLGAFAGYGADEIAKEKQKFFENAEYTTAAGVIDNARGDTKKLAQAAKQIDQFQNLDPEKKRALKDKAFDQSLRIQEVQAKKTEAAARQYEVTLKKAEAAHQSAQGLSDKGILTNEQRDIYSAQMQGTPYAASFRAMLENQAVTGVLAMQPPSKLQAEIDALRMEGNKTGISTASQKRMQQLESVQRGQQADIRSDSLKAYTDRHMNEPVPSINTKTLPEFVASIAPRAAMAAQATAWSGKDTAPLYKAEIDGVRKMLDTLPENGKGEAVAMIAKGLGRSASKGLAMQLDDKDEPLKLAFMAASGGTLEGAKNAQAILNGSRALKDKTVLKDDVAVSGWSAKIAKELDGVFTNANQREQASQATYYLIADAAAKRGGTAGGKQIRNAIRDALGGEIVEQGEGKIVIPTGMTHSDLIRRFKSMKREDLLAQSPSGTVRAAGQEIYIEDLIDRLPSATLSTAAQGQYYVLVPRVPGGKPDSAVVNPQTGKPIIVSAQ